MVASSRVMCRPVRWTRRLAVAAVIAAACGIGTGAQAGDTLSVVVDQAKLFRLPEKTATVVVGNPLIADVSLQPGGTMVITGKGYGSTNLIALDRHGTVLQERAVEVTGPQDHVVVVYRGIERESYSCMPKCERRQTLGDTSTYFDSTLAQIGSRNGAASGGTPTSK